jgi:uncharacterized protein YbjT (DUF2867 family)
MSDQRSVLVTGATGKQGGAAVEALLGRGHRVVALTRNPESERAGRLADRGVKVVAGDFTDSDSLARAATGVDTVYAMTTPFEAGIAAEIQQGLALAKAAKAAGVGHLIFGSVASADQDTGIPHFDSKYAVEKHLASLGVPYTVVAPVYFMDNLLERWSLPALGEGKLAMALPAERRLQQVAVSDIGAFAATLAERREAVFGKRYDIAGDDLTGTEAAAVLSRATGREIRYEGFPADVLRQDSEDIALMFEWFDRVGYSADIEALRREFPEVPWLTYEDWTSKQDWDSLI